MRIRRRLHRSQWPWQLHPWREARRQREMHRRYRELYHRATASLDEANFRLRAQQRELRLAAGTAGWSVGWEQAGGVTPEFVIVGTSRGLASGVRVYASRELAGTAVRLVQDGDRQSRWKLEAILGRAIVSNEPSRREAVEAVQRIWDGWERDERLAAEQAQRLLP